MGVPAAEDALAGARDIMAEWVSEDAVARARLRDLFARKGLFSSTVARGKEEEGAKFRDYFAWSEVAAKAPSHRILAMFRGEKEGFLVLHLEPPEEEALSLLEPASSPAGTGGRQVGSGGRIPTSACWGRPWRRKPALRYGTGGDEAIRVFAENLRELLRLRRWGQQAVLAVDPGFRTGCKIAVA